jgi:tRNA pseudouridine55 synthase
VTAARNDAPKAAIVSRRRVDGVLLLDKPIGISSNRALQGVKRCYSALKAGHTGTLDPLATGLLPICLGEATKFAHALLDATKRYRATVLFGIATTTGDAEGEVESRAPVDFSEGDLRLALGRFVGRIKQVPPRYSALKHNGRNYYEYAREGVEIERVPRDVEIHSLVLVKWQSPVAEIDVVCSKGSYVRTLAEDIALALTCRAHLTALRRTGVGPFDISDAIALPTIENATDSERDAWLMAPECMVSGHARLNVDAVQALALRRGQHIDAQALDDGCYQCYAPEGFMGLVNILDRTVRPQRLLRTGDA